MPFRPVEPLPVHLIQQLVEVGCEDDFGTAVGGFAFSGAVRGFRGIFAVSAGFDTGRIDVLAVLEQQFHDGDGRGAGAGATARARRADKTMDRNKREKLEKLIAAIRELRHKIGIKDTIADYGVSEKDFMATLDEMTENAFDDQCTGANPRYPLLSEIKQIYLNAYYGRTFTEKEYPKA